MKKAAVYTKTGDKGTTGLVGGTRIKKSDPRIHLYGEVDELNSTIGLAISFLDKNFNIEPLKEIQSTLFDLGSNLACEKEKRIQFKLPVLKNNSIKSLEDQIDQMDSKLSELKNFILPGGTSAAAAFHVCRTVCRRLERQMVDFDNENQGEVPENALEYINRLSDYFFTLSRFINHESGQSETLWKPSL